MEARRIIGFSLDGDYLAFEQYGQHDWSDNRSGRSKIEIIDARADQFVGGLAGSRMPVFGR